MSNENQATRLAIIAILAPKLNAKLVRKGDTKAQAAAVAAFMAAR